MKKPKPMEFALYKSLFHVKYPLLEGGDNNIDIELEYLYEVKTAIATQLWLESVT